MQRTGTLATGWIFTIRRRRLFHGRPFSIERMRAIFRESRNIGSSA
jgi:hypothetical protein